MFLNVFRAGSEPEYKLFLGNTIVTIKLMLFDFSATSRGILLDFLIRRKVKKKHLNHTCY
jgi:hypothetical protein